MSTDVAHALEVITASLAGMALLIALLVLAERAILQPPASRGAEQAAARPAARPVGAPAESSVVAVEAEAAARA